MSHPLTLATFLIPALIGCTAEMGTTEPTEATDMLSGLGIDTDLGDRLDHEGASLAEEYNPLGGTQTVLAPKVELYIAGLNGDAQELLLDEESGELVAVEFPAATDMWASARVKDSLGADVDGDGVDEIVTAFLAGAANSLELAIIDPGDGTRTQHQVDAEPAAPGSGSYTGSLGWPMDLASGDLDADGADELLVTLGDTLYILAVDGNTVTELARSQYADAKQVYVAAGNLDADRSDEIVVTWTGSDMHGEYAIYDHDLSEIVAPRPLALSLDGVLHTYNEAWVALGDVDGDHLDEIIFQARDRDSDRWEIAIMDDARAGFDTSTPAFNVGKFVYETDCHTGFPDVWNTYCDYPRVRPSKLALLDYDGDGDDEILGNHEILDLDHGELTQLASLPVHTSNAAVGDVDGDLRDDVSYIVVTGAGVGELRVEGFDVSLGHTVKSRQRLRFPASGDGFSVTLPRVTIAAANVDDDSLVLRYDGLHELLFTDPQVLAAIAAPPYQAGVQSADEATTTFGRATATSEGSSQALGFSVGFSIGVEVESPFLSLAEASVEATFEQAFDFSTAQSVTTESSFSQTTGPGEDMVVFTSVPFDVYHYTIVSSPNPEMVGEALTINLPRDPQTRAMSREKYNSINGDTPDVDEAILSHVPGDVWSYPSAEDRERMEMQAQSGWFVSSNGTLRPTTDAGSSAIGLSRAEGSETGVSGDFNASVTVGAKAGVVTGSVSAGFHFGWSYTMSVEESSLAEGNVDTLPNEAEDYSFGMMMYQHEAGMIVVDYWVEN